MTGAQDSSPASKGLRADARRNRERILAVAEAVFAEHGPTASTEEVAARAGVAVGTIFRHFPTKQSLLAALMKDLLERLTDEAQALAGGDSSTALFTFFAGVVEQAARKKTVVELLAGDGVDVQVADSVAALRQGIAILLDQAQRAGAVRRDVRADEVLALLTSSCHGALHAGWDDDLRRRTLTIIFDGLRAGHGTT
ncbi:TetR family transcriptional regulator [Acrocarpospora corrugata]|uniref:TetR family transcriptional regulator n=1 Tax=Acrocarpospora corrugata TaxID=35763 RepID=A0A5M3VUW9_9ACTN|nr:TetR/AcrR family transcriptional regulator [Acrocarpospora corrugata]GER98177.1 TetR family transcriptional regulator [Acrocarpospora corrugata]